MSVLSRTSSLVRNLLRRKHVEADLDEELRGYVALLAQEKIRDGMNADDARRAALIEAGGMERVKDDVRDARAGLLLETTAQDVRYGLRMLARSPGFTTAAVLALALGIGANSALFSVVDAVLLRPLAYRDPGRLVVLLHNGRNPVAPANFLDWRAQAHAFERMGAAEAWSANVVGGDRPEQLRGLRLTSDVLPLLGVQPLLGRTFLPRDEEAGHDHEIILSYGLWRRSFGADPSVVGRMVALDGEPYAVIGVMPKEFQFAPFWATHAELWAPLPLADRATDRGDNTLRVFARLAPGVTLAQARAEVATITARLEREFPGTNGGVTVTPLKDKVVGDVRPTLLVLLGAAGFVLLIACANVAHMLLARSAARQKEVAVRTALGASRSRMIRQFLTESLILALAGGVAGLALAAVALHALVALGPGNIPRVNTVGLDSNVLAFMMLVSLLTGIGFGLAPALQASAPDLTGALKDGARGSSDGVHRNRMRSVLMTSEFALAVVLLIGAGLMIRSVLAMQRVDPGFNPENLLTMTVSVTGSAEAEPHHRAIFFQQLLQKVQSLPGVQSASAINHLPLAGDLWGYHFHVEGRPIPRPGEVPAATYRVVFPGYFRTMRIPILRGRGITEQDNSNAPAVVVINQWMADRWWPGEDPVGKRITLGDPEHPVWLTVAGVSKNDVQHDWVAPPSEEIFLPYLQTAEYMDGSSSHVSYMTLVVRADCAPSGHACDPAALAPAIRGAVWSFDRSLPVSDVQTMEQAVARSTAEPRFTLLVLAAFAGVALFLAAVGIYGVMSYSVSRRTHEIGLRMALGADRGDVLRRVVGQAMMLTLMGSAVGLAGALLLTRLMSGLLYRVHSTDPLTFVAVAFLLACVALVASYVPARRATRIDPVEALRQA